MQKEQEDLMKRMDRLTPWVRICGAGSVLLILIIAGTWFFTNLTR